MFPPNANIEFGFSRYMSRNEIKTEAVLWVYFSFAETDIILGIIFLNITELFKSYNTLVRRG